MTDLLSDSMNKPVNSSILQWVPSPVGNGVMEMSGNLLYFPTKNKFLLIKDMSRSKAAFSFGEEPLALDNGNVGALFLDAILLLFNDDDEYAGSKIDLYEASNGSHAFGLKGSKYLYLAAPVTVSDTDNRVAVLTFWREIYTQ